MSLLRHILSLYYARHHDKK